MAYQNFSPDARLQEYIQCFWYAERDFIPPKDHFEITPDSFVELVFCFGESDVYFVRNDQVQRLPPAFVVGLLDEPFTLRTRGRLQTLGIRFYAWSFFDFLQLKVSTEPVMALTEEMSQLAAPLRTLLQQDNQTEAIHRLQDCLLEKIRPLSPENNRVRRASRLLQREAGRGNLPEIAAALSISLRQLNRNFKAQVGIGPKAMLRKIRFEKIRDHLFQNPDANLTELAYAFEFADQSHFIHEFRAFTGRTPSAFALEMKVLREELRAAIQQHHVRFSQS